MCDELYEDFLRRSDCEMEMEMEKTVNSSGIEIPDGADPEDFILKLLEEYDELSDID